MYERVCSHTRPKSKREARHHPGLHRKDVLLPDGCNHITACVACCIALRQRARHTHTRHVQIMVRVVMHTGCVPTAVRGMANRVCSGSVRPSQNDPSKMGATTAACIRPKCTTENKRLTTCDTTAVSNSLADPATSARRPGSLQGQGMETTSALGTGNPVIQTTCVPDMSVGEATHTGKQAQLATWPRYGCIGAAATTIHRRRILASLLASL